MKTSSVGAMMAAALLTLGSVGCRHLPGKPGFRPETLRPDQELGFTVLYQSNCSGCHGDSGLNGAALPLNNPAYLTWAGREHLIQIVAKGVPQSAMPAFGRSGGGLLTDEQVEHIVDGMIAHWGIPDVLNNADPPGYTPHVKKRRDPWKSCIPDLLRPMSRSRRERYLTGCPTRRCDRLDRRSYLSCAHH